MREPKPLASTFAVDGFDAFLPGAFVRIRALPDGSEHIEHMSPGCVALWEMGAAEIGSDPQALLSMVDSRDRPALQASLEQSKRDLSDWLWQWRIITPSGRRKWVHGVGRPLREADGSLLWHAFFVDITHSQQAREAELALERRFGAMIDAVPNLAVQGYDGDLVCRYWNTASQALYGWRREEAIGRNLLDLMIPPELADQVRAATRLMMETGQVIPAGEMTLRRQDGSPVTVYSSHVFRRLDGSNSELFCIDYDLTERYEAEATRRLLENQLRESQKMEALGTLAGGVAHDFNNIVAAILGNTELALADTPPAADSAVSLREIRKAARRARDLVQQILTFSRRQDNTRAVTSVEALLDEACDMLRAGLPSEVTLVLEKGEDLPAVWANATQIEQVLLNLITNAVQAVHGQPGGQVRVGLHRCDGWPPEARAGDLEVLAVGLDWPGLGLCFEVSDNGGGMTPETLSHIFEPFFTTKATGSGTGLGLAVVHSVLREHSASLRVRSAPGQGTTFSICLPGMAGTHAPAETDDDTVAVEQQVRSAVVDGARVLYVDDDETMAFLVQRWLERQGYGVTTCSSGEEALACLADSASAFALCISDYNMPSMSGLALAGEVKARWPQLPMAIASGYISEELRQKAPEAGVDELIYKPDTVEALCHSIERLLKRGLCG